jgi:hypothetical protein
MKSAGFLKKTENSIAKIRLRRSSGSIVVFNVVLPGAKSGRPLLHGPETECIHNPSQVWQRSSADSISSEEQNIG